jgi:type IV pilus assembly protein PilM
LSSSLLSFDIKSLKLPRWMTPRSPADLSGGGLMVSYPPVAMDIGATQLALARLTRDKEKKWNLTSYDTIDVAPEILDSEAFKARVRAPDRLRAMVSGSLQREGIKTRAISVVLPDHLARVALLPFEDLPRTRREVLDLVRWKMKKAVPFKVEEATVDYQVMPGMEADGGAAPGYTLLAVLIPSASVEEHESIFTKQGIHAGLIDLSSFSLASLYRSVAEREVPAGDFMMLNATSVFFTAMIFRDGRLIFYRCKATGAPSEGNGEAASRMLRREVQASLMYYQERLRGTSLARVYMRLVGHEADGITGAFEQAPLAAPPELIDPGKVVKVGGRITALGPERAADLLQRLAPAVGAALGRSA